MRAYEPVDNWQTFGLGTAHAIDHEPGPAERRVVGFALIESPPTVVDGYCARHGWGTWNCDGGRCA